MTNGIGIDISGSQPADVPGDWDFIVVKSTEGTWVANPSVAVQWGKAARTARGLYHYARPARATGAQQASVFCDDALGRGFKSGVDIWQLDAEDGLNLGVQSWRPFIDAFMTAALARLGQRGFLYAGWPFLAEHGITDLAAKYKWWLPDYGPNKSAVDNGLAHLGDTAKLVVIHQFTSFGGLDQNVVVDRIKFGTHTQPPVGPADKVKPVHEPAIFATSGGIVDTCETHDGATIILWHDGGVLALRNGKPSNVDFHGAPHNVVLPPGVRWAMVRPWMPGDFGSNLHYTCLRTDYDADTHANSYSY